MTYSTNMGKFTKISSEHEKIMCSSYSNLGIKAPPFFIGEPWCWSLVHWTKKLIHGIRLVVAEAKLSSAAWGGSWGVKSKETIGEDTGEETWKQGGAVDAPA